MKKITIISTQNGVEKEVLTDSKTWGELKEEINEYYDLSVLVATESINRTTLSSNDSSLPDNLEFTIYLRPGKVDSGQ